MGTNIHPHIPPTTYHLLSTLSSDAGAALPALHFGTEGRVARETRNQTYRRLEWIPIPNDTSTLTGESAKAAQASCYNSNNCAIKAVKHNRAGSGSSRAYEYEAGRKAWR